ncbi:MAG: glycoside hydrolase family 20 zincin-like fold domain-containing protein [Candidatus Latescibacterota bacterium]|nr:glycoside hydrolase family 20 zincin-like fold domain-containing protein [Candidatus Latescibacterota bacterium]
MVSERTWIDHLLPRPKEIEISRSHVYRRDELEIAVVAAVDESAVEAAAVLRNVLGDRGESDAQITILIGLLDAVADLLPVDDERLRSLSHAEQAYQITCPTEDQIVVVSRGSPGLYYGALTLSQLLEAGIAQADCPESVVVPNPEIVDWPDFEERGLWNFPDAESWIPWMASMKLNYGKMVDTKLAAVQRDIQGQATIDADLMHSARHRGFQYTPYIVHLNFLHDVGLFRTYPELAGKGDSALAGRYFAHKQGSQHRAPCASQPRLVQLLADWMSSIASQDANDISCWLSERPCQCECEQCTPVGQFVLETRAFVSAWRQALIDYPDLRIRIFSSTTTQEQDDRILAELPKGVRFERCCATRMERVAHQPRDLFANPLLDVETASGRWIASYDVPIGAYGNVDTPEYKVPQFSAQRIRDFVVQLHRRGYEGAYGMLAWGTLAREICGFSISALAEYSWNGEGRPEGDFARAWATRQGLPDPVVFSEWVDLLGPLEFDVYDSEFPMAYSWGWAAEMVKNRRPPRLGEGIFRHVHTVEEFAEKRATCDQALAAARRCGWEDAVRASKVVASYLAQWEALWHVAHDFAHGNLDHIEDQDRLSARVDDLERAGVANVEALTAWRRGLGPEPWNDRVHDAISGTQSTVQRISQHIRNRYLN